MSRQLLVEGHTLAYEGAAHDEHGRLITSGGWVKTTGPGRGKCACGELSKELPSKSARQRWHFDHKLKMKEQR